MKNQKVVYWNLTAGTKQNQETKEQKRKLGNDYIERLKNDGEEIIEVIEEENRLKIVLKDNA